MSKLPPGYPVHYVITIPRRGDSMSQMYQIDDIIASFACDLSEIDALYERYVLPLQNYGPYPRTFLFGREGPNPFLEAEKKERQEIDDLMARFAAEHANKPAAEPDYRDDATWEAPHE